MSYAAVRAGLIVVLMAGALSGALAQPPERPREIPYDRDEPRGECPIDIDIHLPAAQNPVQPVVVEALDETEGAWTLRNNDIDETTLNLVQNRLTNAGDLNRVDARADRDIAGAVADENDLTAVDLHNPEGRNLFFNVYAMARENGPLGMTTNGANQSPVLAPAGRVAVWDNPNRTGVATPTLQVGQGTRRVWIEGLGAGRYRLVLFEMMPGVLADARKVTATETGPIHGRVSSGVVDLKPPAGKVIGCKDTVRLTVAAVDVFQKDQREQVFDVLWGGRPVVDGRVWPGGGNWTWAPNPAFTGTWLAGQVNKDVVAVMGAAPGGQDNIHLIKGAFELPGAGAGAVTGSPLYERRMRLTYAVEGVTLIRDEPYTIMAPDHVTFTAGGALAGHVGQVVLGGTNGFDFRTTYVIFDQHDRRLVGPNGVDPYQRQYGATTRAYEALGMGLNAREANDDVQWVYVSPAVTTRTFTLDIGTKQRRRAIPKDGTLSKGTFTDTFGLTINNNQRGMLQQDLNQGAVAAAARIFAVSQDVVMRLNNGAAEYDVQVARGQVLEILAPSGGPPAKMGFRVRLGAGATPNTGNPVSVGPNHNPPAP